MPDLPENEKHADRIQKQLDAVREMIDEAIANGEPGKVAPLLKLVISTEAVLIKERTRAGMYVGQDEVVKAFQEYAHFVIKVVRPEVTEEGWARIVDAILEWVADYNARFNL